DWIEVRRKKHGSVFDRLKFSQTKASMMDDVAKISLSLYVSNFPSHLTVRELWNICRNKGTLTDVFIAKHKNKLGQMFGFCRFIKVTNSDNLMNSLNSIWIGKMRLHANLARFNRKVGVNPPQDRSKVSPPKNTPVSNVSYPSKTNLYANVAKNSFNKWGTFSSTGHDDSETINQ
nr:reverse transcriptase domain, reverse transcriptase zinc-binding domain protein [Tanacetum cinerariifolium]